MSFRNEHIACIKESVAGTLTSVIRKQIAPGISISLQSGKIKSYQFSESRYTSESARAWLKVHRVGFTSFVLAKKSPLTASVKYQCQCLRCGKVVESEKHCVDIRCSKCGGEMRRASRPGVGR